MAQSDQELREIRCRQFATLHAQGHALRSQYDRQQEESDQLQQQLGWREQFLNGYFGGNKDRARRFAQLQESQARVRLALMKIDEDLELLRTAIEKDIKKELSASSAAYQQLQKKLAASALLRTVCRRYLKDMVAARKQLRDARTFYSWDSLLNHPQAGEALGRFGTATNELEGVLASAQVAGLRIPEAWLTMSTLIRYDSESKAMESFQILVNRCEAIIRLGDSSHTAYMHEATAMEETSRRQYLGIKV